MRRRYQQTVSWFANIDSETSDISQRNLTSKGPGFIVGKTLGHKSMQATAIYARLNLDSVRDSVNAATDAMFAAAAKSGQQ